MRVIDGMHRLRAAIRRGRKLVEVTYFDGDEREAFILAVELNVRHGLPLSLHDRKAAAKRILAADAVLSDPAIASKAVGLSDKTVAAIRARAGADIPQPDGRRGRDGRMYPVGGAEGRQRVAQLIAARPDASLREIGSAVGVSVATVNDVRKRLSTGEDPEMRRPGYRVQGTLGTGIASRTGAVSRAWGLSRRRTPGRRHRRRICKRRWNGFVLIRRSAGRKRAGSYSAGCPATPSISMTCQNARA
jgi:hypothetical protein